jgi:hypothetical protein
MPTVRHFETTGRTLTANLDCQNFDIGSDPPTIGQPQISLVFIPD